MKGMPMPFGIRPRQDIICSFSYYDNINMWLLFSSVKATFANVIRLRKINKLLMNTKSSLILTALSLVMALTGAGTSQAQAIAINNASFESPVVGPGGYTDNSVQGWTIDGTANYTAGVQDFGSGDFSSYDPLAAPADGDQALFVAHGGIVYQDVGALAADTTYTLTLAVGQRLSGGSNDNTGGGIFELINGTTDTGTVLAASTLDTPAEGTFNLQSLTYTTGDSVSGDLAIALLQTSGNQVVFDNVQLTAGAVPEPSIVLLLALGGVATMAVMHYRRSRLMV
jgi:hypothetical protein